MHRKGVLSVLLAKPNRFDVKAESVSYTIGSLLSSNAFKQQKALYVYSLRHFLPAVYIWVKVSY